MKRSKFSLSHYKLLSCDMGLLIPVGCYEALPGDTIQQATSMLLRVSPLLSPVMHPVNVRVHHWFVPNRLLWDGWEDFITGGPDGMNAGVYPHFVANGTNEAEGGLADYLGIPPGTTAGVPYSALPNRAYNLIYNEFYRDQDLQPEAPVSLAEGADTTTGRALLNAAWEKDYFTSARPWTQKGPEVTIPLGLTAPVIGDGPLFLRPEFSATARNIKFQTTDTNDGVVREYTNATGIAADKLVYESGLLADLSTASAANINDIRKAFALQRYEEARARYGSRYTEYLRYLGVRSSDARLQRPEYLGGGKQTIQFSEVLRTGSESTAPIGELYGHGIAAMRSNRYRRFFEEHGIVISLLSVRPKTMYTQGINRMYHRLTKEDYFQKELQHIGQQEVLQREVYAVGGTTLSVFGYQDRYDEYRRMESSVAGDFRSDLDFWHYARIFAAPPVLNGSFVACDPTKRVNAVQDEQVLWVMANHSIQARRMVAASGSSHIF